MKREKKSRSEIDANERYSVSAAAALNDLLVPMIRT